VLVADSRLGGISSSISAYESLLVRGYDVQSVLLFRDDYYQNHDYLGNFFRKKVSPWCLCQHHQPSQPKSMLARWHAMKKQCYLTMSKLQR
ncbi:hypothetical protein NL449_27620, partial [Klebsiella pneumoniae]|nr:hypothetical protein [Klebsiella pneumoniae]